MGQSRPLLNYFRTFLITISKIQIEKNVDGVHGIRTWGRRQNHGAMASAQHHCYFVMKIPRTSILKRFNKPKLFEFNWITFEELFSGNGELIVSCEELSMCKDEIELQFMGKKLDKKDFFGSSDPFLQLSRANEAGGFSVVHRSEHVKNNVNPVSSIIMIDRHALEAEWKH